MQYFAENTLLPEGWAKNVLISIDENNRFSSVVCDQPKGNAIELSGTVIPGAANCHSHAFQRAMAGLAEYNADLKDNFWSWRHAMYEFALKLDPDQSRVVAAQLYLEMLKAGYTSVVEFHYLHHDVAGKSYDNPAAMSESIITAAQQTGINLTHLPVLYMSSNFGNQPPLPHQMRFVHQLDAFIELFATLEAKQTEQFKLGIALHSLRAVPQDAIRHVLDYLHDNNKQLPIHMHIAEQQKEVDDCLRWCKQRPLEWLLDNFEVDSHWNLVHATHLTMQETQRLAASKANLVLCPTTEGNLGDGIFPLIDYLQSGGHFSIGSDSHISVDPIEELRWLEYVQRLNAQQRNVTATANQPHCGTRLWQLTANNNSLATGTRCGKIAAGYQADLLVIDESKAQLAARQQDQLLNSVIFSGRSNCFKDVMVAGKWQIQGYHHKDEEEITANFFEVSKQLLAN